MKSQQQLSKTNLQSHSNLQADQKKQQQKQNQQHQEQPQNQQQQQPQPQVYNACQYFPPQNKELDPQLYQEIVKEEKRVYGKKYQPRDCEPSMFDMLKWQEDVQQAKDFKSQHINQCNEMEKYKYLINKSSTHFQTEQRDNYRQYKYDKDQNVFIPDVEKEVLSKLKPASPQKSTVLQCQPVQHQNYMQEAANPLLQSRYQQDFGVKNINNVNDLIKAVEQNHVNQVTKSKLLLEKAQEKKREHPTNYLYVKDQENEELQRRRHEEQQKVEQQRQWLEENEFQSEEKSKSQKKKFKQPKTKNVKSKLLKYKPQAKQLDAKSQKERLERRQERIKQMEDTTRWLPNTSFTTYFGKPAFENYGMGNVRPTVGGCVYGQYLLTHNVNPHRGNIQPKLIQSYNNALNYGERLPETEPQPPRNVKEDFRLSQKQIEDLKGRNPLEPVKNTRDNLVIKRPDLVNSLRFASNENSPVNTAKNEEEKRKRILNELKQLKQQSQCAIKSQSQLGHEKSQSVRFEETQPKKKVENSKNNENAQSTNAQQQQQSKQQLHQTQQPSQQQLRQQPLQEQPHLLNQQQNVKDQSSQSQNQQRQCKTVQKTEPQHYYENPQRSFMEELQQKKAMKNRIALKVTEVVPERPHEHLNHSNNQNQPQIIQQLDVPEELVQDYKSKIYNPKLYKNVPSQYLQLIPAAGVKCKPHEDIGFVFKHNQTNEQQLSQY